MSAWRPFLHEFTESDICAHCCLPNINGCEARLTPQEWFSYQVWNTSALDRFKVNLKKTHGGANNLNICEHAQCNHPTLGCGWLSGGDAKLQLRCAACEDLKHVSGDGAMDIDYYTGAGPALKPVSAEGGGVQRSSDMGKKQAYGSIIGCGMNNLREAGQSRSEQFSEFFEHGILR